MSTGKLFYKSIFFEIGLALILNIVIQCKDNLVIIVNLGRSAVEELLDDREGVVVRHAVLRPKRYKVSRLDNLSRRKTN